MSQNCKTYSISIGFIGLALFGAVISTIWFYAPREERTLIPVQEQFQSSLLEKYSNNSCLLDRNCLTFDDPKLKELILFLEILT